MNPDRSCAECAKFHSDWRGAILDLSRRSAVYAASLTATNAEAREEEAARIEGARLRADAALAALRAHRRTHRSSATEAQPDPEFSVRRS